MSTKKVNTQICPYCGQEKPSRGFNLHVEACKKKMEEPQLHEPVEIISDVSDNIDSQLASTETTEIQKALQDTKDNAAEPYLKDLPLVAIQAGTLTSLNKERQQTQIETQIAPNKTSLKTGDCTCKGYDGQDFNCPVHPAKVECPYCRCIDTAQSFAYSDPCQTYRCTMCGGAYQRNLATGEYIYD